MAYDFECKHLTKRFDNGDIATLALDDVNLHFAHGDLISIIGPSGSGKSTLLSLIGTLDRPTDGTLLFKGEPIFIFGNAPAYKRRKTRDLGNAMVLGF